MKITILVSLLFLFVIYSNAQNIEWAHSIGGPPATTPEYNNDMVIDTAGNVYIIGSFWGSSDFNPDTLVSNYIVSEGDFDVYFAKYDKDGNYIWAHSIGSTLADAGYAIDVDKNGNVLISGFFADSADFNPGAGENKLYSNGLIDIFFAKYDNNGNFIWAKSAGGNNGDYCYGIASDNAGNVYITGSFADTADFDPGVGTANLITSGSASFYLAKYDANGNYQWAFATDPSGSSIGRDIVCDNAGNILVTGDFQSFTDFDPGVDTAYLYGYGNTSVFFAKYDNNGGYIWANAIGGTYFDEGHGITVDDSDNILITGIFNLTADFDPGAGNYNLTTYGSSDAFLAKYNPNGDFVWANKIGSTDTDYGYDVASDDSANVYITGVFWDKCYCDPADTSNNIIGAFFADMFFAKYDSDGNYIWAYPIASYNHDRGRGIAVDNMFNIYVSGYYQNTADFDPGYGAYVLNPGGYDTYIAKYNYSDCSNIDTTVSINAGMLTANATGVNYQWLDCNNNYQPLSGETGQNLILSGSGSFAVLLYDGVCIDTSACYLITDVNQLDSESNIAIYPNPTSGLIHIDANNIEQIEVLNQMGQIIYTGEGNTDIDLSRQPAGVYFVRVNMNDKTAVVKVLKR